MLCTSVLVAACAVAAAAQGVEDDPRPAVEDLLQRLLGAPIAQAFDLELLSPRATTRPLDAAVLDVFELDGGGASGQNVTVRGNSGSALTAGVGWYLKYYANCSVAWSGAQLALALPLPAVADAPVRVQAAVPYRYYLNTCTHSYTMAFWDWARWERELDWMAVQGINMPLTFTGQEFVWAQVYTALGVTESELLQHFVGPAFLAWGRMGNIRGYGGPLDAAWRAGQAALQQKIVARARALGMVTVLPGFAGHVPEGLRRVFPAANITRSPLWAGFNDTYSGDYLLDANDPLFATIAGMFIDAQTAAFGTSHVYNADTFNEMVPASNDTAYLTATSHALYAAMAKADPDAVWMIQGWMFSFQPSFWQPAQIKAYLAGVPDDRMIILDLNAFADPIWARTDSFYGKPFIWCAIDNAGGREGMFGNLSRMTEGPAAALANVTSTMVGVGLAPEGTMQNPISYELLAEMGWRRAPVDVSAWVRRYAQRRYGPRVPDAALHAWDLMRVNLYNDDGQEFSAMFADRPSLTMGRYSTWTNATAMVAAWRLFHNASFALAGELLFAFDYVDVTRQSMAFIFEELYTAFTLAAHVNDSVGLAGLGDAMVELVFDIDAVLATHRDWLIGTWTEAARAWGGDRGARADLYERNARHLYTIWGPNGELNGYADRQLAGLVRDYHGARWQLFVERVQAAVASKTPFDQAAFDGDCFELIERPWAEAVAPRYTNETGGDVVAVVDGMFAKYAGPLDNSSLAKHYLITPDSDGNGDLFGGYRAVLIDPAVMESLCNVNPVCGGFIADGWFKPLNVEPVPFPGSTLYTKATPRTLCLPVKCAAPLTGGAAECNGRCNCQYEAASQTCACVGLPGRPACERSYPRPSNATLARLVDPAHTPLRPTDRISFFGDSITWLGGYIEQFRAALGQAGLGNVTLSNRGINGGTAKDVRDGATLFGTKYPSFNECLALDGPTIVTIFIGINDVWFPSSNHSSPPPVFGDILRDLVQRAHAAQARVVLATVSVIGEKIDGSEPYDAQLVTYAGVTRNVTNTTAAALADIHSAYTTYDAVCNTEPAGVGLHDGVLTVDGVHPCEGSGPAAPCPADTHANVLLADTLAAGILDAFEHAF